MTSLSKRFGLTLLLTAAVLAGCSETAIEAPVENAPQTQPAVPEIPVVQIGGTYKSDIATLKNQPVILAAF